MAVLLGDFVKYLLPDPINAPTEREKFFKDPFGVMKTWAGANGPFSDEQIAILFSMDRAVMVRWCKEKENVDIAKNIMGYDFRDVPSGTWAPGDKWETPTGCAEEASPAAPGSPSSRAMMARAGSGGGGWTAPTPQITRVDPPEGPIGKKAKILVVGEGFVDKATLILSNPYNVSYKGYAYAQLDLCSVANFRRMYLKGEIDLKQIDAGNDGQYELRILNPGAQKPILWRSRYTVKP
jgi:hypothetical protein